MIPLSLPKAVLSNGLTKNMFIILRVLLGSIFLVSGLEKLLSPYQNFLYTLEAYQLFPNWLGLGVALGFPWVEVLTGIFVVLGLWTQVALRAVLILFAGFIVVVGQALLRGLPLDNCGCFGDLVHVPARWIIVFDSVLFLLTLFGLRYPAKLQRFGLDQFFHEQ